ncbi:Sodium/calcium exchanger protein [Ceratobasidium sp. AG-Ba]|nr:Sodium/calcium exchanger protein [Ceratobasidium sp. AG-Ba]
MSKNTLSTNASSTTAVSFSTFGEDITLNDLPRCTSPTGDLEANDKAGQYESTRPRHRLHSAKTRSLSRTQLFLARFRGEGRRVPGWSESAKNTLTQSWLNVFLVFIPLSWAGHWAGWNHSTTFAFAFLGVIPLTKLLDYGGEQMSLYLGESLGDLISITLGNAIEGILAIFLLTSCQLKLLQSTTIGVLLLHLLLVPGMTFLVGGARVREQRLEPRPTQLNRLLLMFGILSLLLPLSFFAALPRTLPNISAGAPPAPALFKRLASQAAEINNHTTNQDTGYQEALMRAVKTLAIQDTTRNTVLKLSRGLAVLLLIAYIGSRIYLYLPSHGDDASSITLDEAEADERENEDPEINPWFGLILLAFVVGLTIVTAEWLSGSIEPVQQLDYITSEWFGIVLLPMLSYAADACIIVLYFVRSVLFLHPEPPSELAKVRSIDMSVQFALFWTPLVVLIGWWSNYNITLLFDLWEITVLVGAVFLVNYVTADVKTDWAEGMVMVLFYIIIALVTWFYDGQPEIYEMLQCAPIAETLALVAGKLQQADSS